jgi:ribosome-associated toxin RatA of RatAB toxin-antitoxin module
LLLRARRFYASRTRVAGALPFTRDARVAMQCVRKSVLVPFAASRMYDLVNRVDLYPQFLPWCGGTKVLAESEHHKTARIDIDYHGVRAHFTTDNAMQPPDSIVITLKDGPFRHLHGEWRFRALGEDGCKIEFELAYEFATKLLDRVIGPVFGHIANTFIDAFVRRAEAVYGEGKP